MKSNIFRKVHANPHSREFFNVRLKSGHLKFRSSLLDSEYCAVIRLQLHDSRYSSMSQLCDIGEGYSVDPPYQKLKYLNTGNLYCAASPFSGFNA